MPRRLSLPHALLALAIVFVWGTNFAFIRMGLDKLPPLLFAALRYLFAAVPGVFLLKRPAVPWKKLAIYGLLSGPFQFGVLYMAMKDQISPGLASLVIQSQVFFTIGLSLVVAGEKLRVVQVAALALATAGIVVIATHVDASTTVLGLGMTLFAGLSWALANMTIRSSGPVNVAAFVAWSSLFSTVPLFAMSLVFEGPAAMARGFHQANWITWLVVFWQSYGNVMFGFALWGWLLARYPAATITPTALLVPVFGMGASAVLLAEPLPGWKLIAAGLVIAGLAVGMLWPPPKVTSPSGVA